MKLLIIGGVIFIGRSLVKQALDAGHDVTVLALDKPAEDVKWISVNRNDVAAMKKALTGLSFDAVIDNIAYTADQVRDVVTILAGHIKRYVLTSSVDTYENVIAFKDEIIHETLLPVELDPNNPRSNYLRNKRNAETWLRNSTAQIEKVVIRPSMVTGRHDNVRIDDAGVHYGRSLFFPLRLIDGKPILLSHTARSIFHLIHADDLARALLLAATHEGMTGLTLNAAGTVFTAESLIYELASSIGMKAEIIRAHDLHTIDYKNPYQRSDNPGVSVFSIDRLMSFGWQPTPVSSWGPTLFENIGPSGIKKQRDRELAFIKGLNKPARLNANYFSRFNPASYNLVNGKKISNIGIGTFYGEISAETDEKYRSSILTAVNSGINLIDTAINYRNEHSERIVSVAVEELVSTGSVVRDDLFIVTKGGFVPSGMFSSEELISKNNKRHCITAGFIDASLSRSLINLDTYVDAYLLHNPESFAEQHYFYEELAITFALLEQRVREGKIKCYGIATWDGLIVDPTHKRHVNLRRVLDMAKIAAGGRAHSLKVVELPFNLFLPDAMTKNTQDGMPALAAVKAHGLYPLISASINRGQIQSTTLASMLPTLTPVMRSVQAARSISNGTALIGMRTVEHVEQAIELLNMPTLNVSQLSQLQKNL